MATQSQLSTANAAISVTSTSSRWDKLCDWVSSHKAVVCTVSAVTVAVSGFSVYYVVRNRRKSSRGSDDGISLRKRKPKNKKDSKDLRRKKTVPDYGISKDLEPLPDVTHEYLEKLPVEERTSLSGKLKNSGNLAYKAGKNEKAIELYTQALLCKDDPVFYANRAACHFALSNWQDVIDDTTAALKLNPFYVKALNRRANAYVRMEKLSEALFDFTVSCLLDKFSNRTSVESVERLLKRLSEVKAKDIMLNRKPDLPSAAYVSNYLSSFRQQVIPSEVDENVKHDEGSGKYYVQKGLSLLKRHTGDNFNKASEAFEKAIEANQLGDLAAFAYNMRGTFRHLRGLNQEALNDFNTSIKLDPKFLQSYVKRASMYLEQGDKDKALENFELAIGINSSFPDIYYHRAQLHFVFGEFDEALQDYKVSISLDPNFIFSHIQMGVTQYKMGLISESMETFQTCMKKFGDIPDLYNYYGELLLDQHKFEEAVEKFDKAVEMEKKLKPMNMNVLPLINKALAVFQWKEGCPKGTLEALDLCEKALIVDPMCDIAVATMAQLLLQQGKIREALTYWERAASLARTLGEATNASSFVEATRVQILVQEKYPEIAGQIPHPGSALTGE